MTTPTDAALASEIRRKELGYVSHFLDAVWEDLGKAAILAIGVSGASGYLSGGLAPWVVPVGMLAGMLPAAGKGLARLLDARDMAEAHDTPAVQGFIRQVETKARGAVASQRGSVWIVREPGAAEARVMGDREYARFKRDAARDRIPLDEVVLRRGEATLTRSVGGLADPGGRDLPAKVRLDAGKGSISWTGWFLRGRSTTPTAVAAAAKPGYSASKFLSGGTGAVHEPAPARVRAPERPAYSSSRFLSGGSGYDADEPAPGPRR